MAYMDPQDAVYGSAAKCYVTMKNQNGEDERYEMFIMTEFEAKFTPNIKDVKILGKTMMGHKVAGGKGTFSGKMHYNTSIFRKWAIEYIESGVMRPFQIDVTNSDKTASIGSQTICYYGCLLDSIVLSKFMAGEDLLDEDISGTFDNCKMPEKVYAILPQSYFVMKTENHWNGRSHRFPVKRMTKSAWNVPRFVLA